MRPCTVAVATLALASGGCTGASDVRELEWRVDVDEPIRSSVVVAITRIRDGGCDGTALYTAELWTDGSRTPPDPPHLPAGTYGFDAEARDAACRVLATGCVELSLPVAAGATVLVELTPLEPPSPACTELACEGGLCAAITDGGRADATADSAPADGAPDDSAPADATPADADVDACSLLDEDGVEGPGPGGGVGVGTCDNGIDDDCDGLEDCDDPDCDGQVCAADRACFDFVCTQPS